MFNSVTFSDFFLNKKKYFPAKFNKEIRKIIYLKMQARILAIAQILVNLIIGIFVSKKIFSSVMQFFYCNS